jgi:hypothetical protein
VVMIARGRVPSRFKVQYRSPFLIVCAISIMSYALINGFLLPFFSLSAPSFSVQGFEILTGASRMILFFFAKIFPRLQQACVHAYPLLIAFRLHLSSLMALPCHINMPTLVSLAL